MGDRLEKFVQEHNEEFDIYAPPAGAWNNIERKLKKKEEPVIRPYWAWAAAVLVIVVSFAWFNNRQGGKQTISPIQQVVSISPELVNAEVYYASIVENQHQEIKQLGKGFPEVCNDLDNELRNMDTLYGQLKNEYLVSGGNEAVMQAMVENLQARVQLMNQQLQLLKSISAQKSAKGHHLESM